MVEWRLVVAAHEAAGEGRTRMDLGLEGKQVLITGGSKGIGLAVAHAFAAEGANIVIASRDAAVLEKAAGEVRRKHNAKVAAHAADLSDAGQRAAHCIRRFPRSTCS